MEHLREFFLRKMLLNLRNYGTFAGNFPAFVASARASLQYP